MGVKVVRQVEDLTRQLEQLSAQATQAQAHPGTKAYFVQLHLERLRAELMYRNKLNDQVRIFGLVSTLESSI